MMLHPREREIEKVERGGEEREREGKKEEGKKEERKGEKDEGERKRRKGKERVRERNKTYKNFVVFPSLSAPHHIIFLSILKYT